MVQLNNFPSRPMHGTYLNRVATAVPDYECHETFLNGLPTILPPEKVKRLQRVASQSQIQKRYSVLNPLIGEADQDAYYRPGRFPSTGDRMQTYRKEALPLASRAIRDLNLSEDELEGVTHLIVTSCTGFYAPGLDIEIIREWNLSPSVRRLLITYMGCYAAISGLRAAQDIVRSNPEARVLMVNLELCSLHLQESAPMDRLISFLLFADGCAASLITADDDGFELMEFQSSLGLSSRDRMQWMVEDQGFAMTLDIRVPSLIQELLDREKDAIFNQMSPDRIGMWAVHPGGRAILDSIQSSFDLNQSLMEASRAVLRDFGNMSSATVMFVLELLLKQRTGTRSEPGMAMAFGPGLTVESMSFR
jgi:predicted naringenin-chalcone synthase